jgi:head-tail adaptor
MFSGNRFRPENNPLAISPGELRHAVSIQQPDFTAAGARGKSAVPTSWNTVRETRAAIYTAGGRETAMASQIVSQVSHVVKIRWTDVPVKAGYRIAFGARVMTISYVENVLERNRVLLLYCQEIDGSGQ